MLFYYVVSTAFHVNNSARCSSKTSILIKKKIVWQTGIQVLGQRDDCITKEK